MRLGIVGGMLQGIESAYLARKAGFETLVIDRRPDAPALSLADECMVLDVVRHRTEARRALSDCDAVLPANENLETLTVLDRMLRDSETPLLFDLESYNVSRSKALSNQMMEDLNVPTPRPWPGCGFPAVVKPSGQSGSAGVVKVRNEGELERGLRRIEEMDEDAIVQEFVEGPNVSIEVIGDGNQATPMVLTEVVLDNAYDCKMVRCPIPEFNPEVADALQDHGCKIAENLALRGIMDLEAIIHNGAAKVLEFDARIPSQTPAAVLHATGINLVKVLFDALVEGVLNTTVPNHHGAAIYEHIIVDGEVMRSCGEGTFSQVKDPRLQAGLFGSDEMITDYAPGRESWHATIICAGDSPQEAWNKRQSCLEQIMEKNKITQYVDSVPEMER